MKVGDLVKAKVSFMVGYTGKVVGISKTELPIAVVFEGSPVEWDFKEDELEVQKNE